MKNDNNQLSPPPDEINLEEGKSKWVIDNISVWAHSYVEALEIYSLIKQ
jgi:hypothetical protein